MCRKKNTRNTRFWNLCMNRRAQEMFYSFLLCHRSSNCKTGICNVIIRKRSDIIVKGVLQSQNVVTSLLIVKQWLKHLLQEKCLNVV